ncbi:unnamed protein product [Psylliodes chrysocephalus]|uniref:Uncharacterized protein n=1 Tax=Psylliodes chrysocephalus TaxID=3402493 RepID=A0A9P0CU94_9CUCU|nr:unnamed protein product [Psylliodes chrysocephala]
MTHYNDYIPPSESLDPVLIIFYVLIGVVTIAQVFYIFYSRYSYKTFKNVLLQRGRLLQIVPIVTVSTIQSVQGGVQNVVHPVDFQASAPSNLYTAADGSRIIDNKVAPPAYVP